MKHLHFCAPRLRGIGFCILGIGLSLALGCDRAAETSKPLGGRGQADLGPVTVIIDGEPAIKVLAEDVAAETTVAEVMRKLDQPSLEIKITGRGTTAFLESMGGRATTDGEGWLFEVDGESSPVGIGSATLTPPTTVRWRHGRFDEMMD